MRTVGFIFIILRINHLREIKTESLQSEERINETCLPKILVFKIKTVINEGNIQLIAPFGAGPGREQSQTVLLVESPLLAEQEVGGGLFLSGVSLKGKVGTNPSKVFGE